MTQICFDSHSIGTPATDDHRADVRGPGAGYVFPSMMARKFIGKTAGKVVRLSDIYRIPKPIGALFAEDVDSANEVKDSADGVVLEFVSSATFASPDKAGEGLD
jgi:hypothetical protein